MFKLCNWHGIAFTETYTPQWSCLEHGGRIVSHIEVNSKQHLPITSTCYKSHFFYQDKDCIAECINQEVLELLEKASRSKEWQAYELQQKQASLFQKTFLFPVPLW